jgi:SAM-dependent methyltransferase
MAGTMSPDSQHAEARICPYCKRLELVGLGETLWPANWTCPSCGKPVLVKNGIPQYAPALADTLTGFDPADFEMLALQEEEHFWFEPRNRLLVGLAESYFSAARRYLEIGCGTGFALGAFASSRRWSRLVGSEIHPAGILAAQKRLGGHAEFVQMDARSIPARCAFDLVGAFDVLEHIVEDETVIGAVHSVLVPGGGFIAAVPQHPSLWSEVDQRSYHVRRYRPGELEEKLCAAGFDIVFSTSYLVVLLPLMVASRLLDRWRSGSEGHSEAAVQQFNLPKSVNAALRLIVNAEVALTLKGARWPFGGSRIVVAQRVS